MEMEHELFEQMWKMMKENHFEIADDIRPEYTCIICKKILINACSAQCGCRFCLDCIKQYVKDDKKKCPGQSHLCGDELIDIDTDIQINRLINKRISKLSIKCPNIDCQSQMELRMIVDHVKNCESEAGSGRYFILEHKEQKFERDKGGDRVTNKIQPHTDLLMEWIRDSQNEWKSLRMDIDKLRLDNDGLKEKMRSDGERSQRIIEELWTKERENSSEIEMLNDEMCGLKNSNRSMKDKLNSLKQKQSDQIAQFEMIVENQNQEIQKLKTQVENQNHQLEQFQQRCVQIETSCEEIRHQSDNSNIELVEMSNAVATMKAESRKTLKLLRVSQEIDDNLNCGEFVWKIDEWSNKMKTNRTIFSDPFESHPSGYKMCLCAQFRPRNLYVYFCVMKGVSDEMLRWPFDRVVELSLINHRTGSNHKPKTIKCFDYPNDSGFQRPTKDRNKSSSSFDLIISNAEIEENSTLCRNDQIWIKLFSRPAK